MTIEDGNRSRPAAGESLAAVGRAARYACTVDGAPAETWSLPSSDRALVARLVAFGADRLGGFSGAGEDEQGVFVVRRVPSRTLESFQKGEAIEGLSAVAKVRDLARGLAACEARGVFPGPLRPQEIAFGGTDAFVLADGWVRALFGGEPAPRGSSLSPRWTPPEQAAGAPWDSRANRYVLGLAAYRLVAGVHPFAGVGLREAMDAARSAPPPFEDRIARSLKPGIQSFVLALLDPDPERRPPSARAIVQRCEELLRSGVDVAVPVRASLPAPALRMQRPRAPAAASTRRLATFAPIAFGLAMAGMSFGFRSGGEPARAPAPARVLARGPLKESSAETCAPCHARQVAEWRRSVMAPAVKSPLFGALESLVEEQVGRDDRCPNGAGILRRASADVCRDERTSITATGSGGEHWCINCHSAGDNLRSTVPAWSATGDGASRRPLGEVLSPRAMEGISCAVCHETIGPVHAGVAYQGNPTWTSPVTGATFRMRPEDSLPGAQRGIANSGYLLDDRVFFSSALGPGGGHDPIVHRRVPEDTARYVRSSEFCGACHDVRLFGTDSIGVAERGEHFKRLRNAYSEWRTWAASESAAGRKAASCQDCHMSLYPGVCVRDASGASGPSNASALRGRSDCPPKFHFEARAPGERARGLIASSSTEMRPMSSHFFTSVDVPLASDFDDAWAHDRALDEDGLPLGLEARRAQLLRRTFAFAVRQADRVGTRLSVPIEIQNNGAGHRVPAGFSQEREIWVELTVRDARDRVVYEVGSIDRDDADLRDKVFLRTTTGEDVKDERGRPQGVFGADVADGPDLPRWAPNPAFGGTTFRGKGLINMQNGFLRCVRCIGLIDAEGRCQPGPGQGRTRADRFADGDYDIDTGACRSNLAGNNAFFETYFPVGALDAERGVAKAPDAILDQRSAAPGVVLRYTYELDVAGPGPFTVSARLRFRPFPPFLLRAFADYETRKAAEGRRARGPQLTAAMFARNHPIDLASAQVKVP